MRRWFALSLLLASCGEEAEQLHTVPPEVCLREYTPQSYDVYFAIDVSGSMGPFLTDVQSELIAFAENLPKFTDEGLAVQVQYFVVAFVNDVRWYPANVRKLRDVDRVQAAFEEAIAAGADNLNLNAPTFNAEREENLLDALREVLETNPSAEANLVMVATDAPFAEAPDFLSGEVEVRSTFEEIHAGLTSIEARVHTFSRPESDGLTRRYHGLPGFNALPGSTVHDINELTGARDAIRETLTLIAESADCN